jgi:cell division protein ZipA
MDELRLSLIVIGVVIVGGVYAVGKMVERSRAVPFAKRRTESVVESSTPLAARASEHDFKMPVDVDTEQQLKPVVVAPPAFAVIKTRPPVAARAPEAAKAPLHPTPRESDLIVSLTLLARDQQKFNGVELHKALQAAGLELAEFDIYHFRDADAEDDARAVFSVANIVKPGTFDVAKLHELTTPGLAMFMQIPGPMTASEAFDAMLEKAQFIAQRLHGIVGDEQRTPLSPQRMRTLRERTLNYDFAHSVQGSAGNMQPTQRPH